MPSIPLDRPSKRALNAALLVVLVAVVGALFPALASHPEVSLPGSGFEIDTDANTKVDDGPSDWNNVAEASKDDDPYKSTDNSFVQGTKEDTAVTTNDGGSIPPNKSDLRKFGVWEEKNASGRYLHMYWTRVQDPSDTTNMDFEFN